MRERYTRKQKLIIYAVCFVGLTITFISSFYSSKKRNVSLLAHEGFTTGLITQVQHGRGTAIMNTYLEYKITIKGKIITSEYDCWGIRWDSLIGKSFPVVYDTTTPDQSNMLIFPSDFEGTGLTFPDSLKWVLKYKK